MPDSVIICVPIFAVLAYLLMQDVIDWFHDRAFKKALARAEQRIIDRIESGEYDHSLRNLNDDIQFEHIRAFNE